MCDCVPEKLVCGVIPNKAAEIILSIWIIVVYISWGLWVLLLFVLPFSLAKQPSIVVALGVSKIMVFLLMNVLQTGLSLAFINCYSRLKALENVEYINNNGLNDI